MVVPGAGSYNRVDPKDAFSWGLRLGFLVSENVEVGGLFNLQSTSLEASGTNSATLGDQKVYNYHGYLAYNFGDDGSQIRPTSSAGWARRSTAASAHSSGTSSGRSAATPSSRPPGRSA